MRPYNHLFCVLLYQVQEYSVVASSSLSFNSSNNHTTNLSTTCGFIFPNDHSQHRQQQQQRSHPMTSSHLWNPNLFSASSRLENGKWELGEERLRISGFYHNSLAPSTIELRISDHHHRQQSHFVGSTAATSNILL